MHGPTKKQISDSRLLLQNPYAHDNGEGGYSAAPSLMEASAKQTAADRKRLENQYAHLDGAGLFSAKTSVPESRADDSPQNEQLTSASKTGYQWIERAAKKLRDTIWYRRHEIWPDGVPADPVDMLDPAVALRLVHFDYDLAETLGQLSNECGTFEVAGIIDRPSRRVRISRRLPFNTRKFTTAHEVGHAVLHDGIRMHRDRPLDGSQGDRGMRDKIEIEADKFATFFLMPDKLVRTRFRQVFLPDRFIINEAAAFALDPSDSFGLLSGKKTMRELSRILASCGSYNSRHFASLAEQFHVSVESMAIRLEELDLLDV